uniref:Uncharacterized protein n=1 Tax=Octopus bimaculoides TaxID=37653 RepID=A0A0L8IED2_OCTBM
MFFMSCYQSLHLAILFNNTHCLFDFLPLTIVHWQRMGNGFWWRIVGIFRIQIQLDIDNSS